MATRSGDLLEKGKEGGEKGKVEEAQKPNFVALLILHGECAPSLCAQVSLFSSFVYGGTGDYRHMECF